MASKKRRRNNSTDDADVRRMVFRFLLVFLPLVTALLVALAEPVVFETFREPFCTRLASICAAALGVVGVQTSLSGTLLSVGGIHVEIVRQCDGLQALAILVSAIAAFPATLKSRAIGLLLAIPLVLAINVLRIGVLVLLGLVSKDLFQMIHVYVFQVALIGAVAAIFIGWTRVFATESLARLTA
ncbi:MAG: exosortase H [bacterium]|nr:exosortase H [bacterium]